MISFFSNIFGYVLNWIYILIQNYGFAIIIFSVLVKLAMLPLSIKQQKTMKKNEKVQAEMKILQVKHKGNPEMLNQEVMELYKREKINPFGGCLTVILQFILLISMFYLVRSPLTYMRKVDKSAIDDKIVAIQEENEDNTINKTYPEIGIVKYVQNNNLTDDEMYINMNFLGLDLSNIPQENLQDFKVFIIPALYIISSVISMRITTASMNKKDKDEKNEIVEKNESKELTSDKDNNEMDQAEMSEQMNKTMSWMMPVLAVSISLVAPLGLALYWLVNNIMMIIERLFLNKMFSREEDENA